MTNFRQCQPGHYFQRGHCRPGTPAGSPFLSLPRKTLGVPGGGLFPFSNVAGSGVPASPPAPEEPFFFQFSGQIDSSAIQTIHLDLPFSRFGFPITTEEVYTFTPSDYRTNDGGFGGMGLDVSVPEKNLGFLIQFSNPSTVIVSTYTDYVPIDPDNSQILRHDYSAIWPPGTPTWRLVIGDDLVPRLFFDGTEAVLIDLGPSFITTISSGNRADLFGTAGAPGLFVNVERLTMEGGLILPPTPL